MQAWCCPWPAAFLIAALLWPTELAAYLSWTMTIHGTSMAPRLADGERIVVQEPFCGAPLARGDIVVFLSDALQMPLIKTIRGLAGDRLAVEGDRFLINGKIALNSQAEPYRLGSHRIAMLDLYARDYHGVIPAGTMLVMGEAPSGTLDSSRFGLVELKKIIARFEMKAVLN